MYAMQGLTTLEAAAIWVVFGIAILGLLYANFLRTQILKEDKGTAKMQEVWGAIKDGASSRQTINVGGADFLDAVTAQLGAQIIDRDEQNVHAVERRRCGSGEADRHGQACHPKDDLIIA